MRGEQGKAAFVTPVQIRPLFWLLQQKGLDSQRILSDGGYPVSLANPASSLGLPLGEFCRLFMYSAAECRESTCYLSARPLLPDTRDFIFSTFLQRKRLFEALAFVSRSYNLAHGSRHHILERKKGTLSYKLDGSGFPFTRMPFPGYPQFIAECLLMLLHAVVLEATANRARPFLQEVHIAHKAEAWDRNHLEFWEAPLKFEARQNAVYYREDAVEIEVGGKSSGLLTTAFLFDRAFKRLDQIRNARSATQGIVMRASSLVAQGISDQARVSEHLGISTSTLQRQLRTEGTDFRSLKDEVFKRRARALIDASKPLADIAEELGYSDVRSFTRAYKRWTGLSPRTGRD